MTNPMLIGIAGGTGSGKSTFAEGLRALYPNDITIIAYDNYYKPQDRIWDYMVERVKRTDSIYRVHDSGIHLAKNQTCPTLTASMGTRNDMVPIVIDNFGYRKLTVRECLEFQCFPKDFSFPIGTTIEEAYKQIGNSVCVTVIQRIAEQIKRVMEDEDVL